MKAPQLRGIIIDTDYIPITSLNPTTGTIRSWIEYLTPLPIFLMVPIALLNVLLVLWMNRRDPRVLWYLPEICRLKWANARGVYQGFLNPSLCLHPVKSLHSSRRKSLELREHLNDSGTQPNTRQFKEPIKEDTHRQADGAEQRQSP